MARDYRVYVSNNFIGVVGLTPEQIKELNKDYVSGLKRFRDRRYRVCIIKLHSNIVKQHIAQI